MIVSTNYFLWIVHVCTQNICLFTSVAVIVNIMYTHAHFHQILPESFQRLFNYYLRSLKQTQGRYEEILFREKLNSADRG